MKTIKPKKQVADKKEPIKKKPIKKPKKKTKKKTKNKRVLLTKAKKKAFAIWSETVREANGHACAYCGAVRGEPNVNGKPVVMNAHHIITRDNPALRYEFRNGCCLCRYCHKFSRTGAHRGSIVFNEWFRETRPEDYYYLIHHHDDIVEDEMSHIENSIEVLSNMLLTLTSKGDKVESNKGKQ